MSVRLTVCGLLGVLLSVSVQVIAWYDWPLK